MAFSLADVEAGAVLLFRGTSQLARLIRLFDESEVNHATIALGGGKMADALVLTTNAPSPIAAADPSFRPAGAGVDGALGAAAVKGALEGTRDIRADPNFVTPRDLLRSTSLRDQGRIG